MQPAVYKATEHDIDSSFIDRDALQVVHRLRQAGYEAYLVGGSVRDLLIKKAPKDFDISTSAKPEQIKQLFGRQCLLIGRRFRLAHIRFGHKIIEVATFRSGENEDELIVHDNEWGTPVEDVMRRDFTINGLFYDPEEHVVIDYVGGWEDIHSRTLRTIGDANVRFKQDPVRMIRLLKFKARFGFNIEKGTLEALSGSLKEITKSSQARVLEECLRMMESCASAPFFDLVKEQGLLDYLFPPMKEIFHKEEGSDILKFFDAADKINLQSTRYPIERPVLSTSLVWPIVEKEVAKFKEEHGRIPHLGEILVISASVIKHYINGSFTHFPKRISALMNYVITTQYRLTSLSGKKSHPFRLFKIREFPLALRFLKMRAALNPDLQPTYIAWRENYRTYLRQGDKHTHPHVGHRHRMTRKGG